MGDLVSLEMAKEHLRVEHADDDSDIGAKITAASAAIVSYCKTPEAAAWDQTTVPKDAQIACLLLVAQFYSARESGDFTAEPANFMPTSVMALLARLRDPACA